MRLLASLGTGLFFMLCQAWHPAGLNAQEREFMPLKLEKLGPGINSPDYDESAPVISRDGSTLFFTRTASPDFMRTLMNGDEDISRILDEPAYLARLGEIYSILSGRMVSDPVRSVFNQDIWMASTDISKPNALHPGYPVNNALPNSIVSTGKDTNCYVSINQFYRDGSMYAGFSTVCIENDSTTTFPEPIHIYDFEAKGGDVNLAMSADGNILVISMSRFDSHGENDLYVCFRLKPNLYSKPKHMGPVLNSPGQETTPFISSDNRKLYFSSNRPGTLGGNDIYVSDRQDYTWRKWSDPVPLEVPFNSPADDSQPFFDAVHNDLYFSSKRDGTSDIFRVSLTPVPKLQQPVRINGKIMDSSTGKILPAEVFWGPGSAEGYLEFFRTNTGSFTATLTENESYKFLPRKANYRAHPVRFDALEAAREGVYTYDIVLYLTPKELFKPADTTREAAADKPADVKQQEIPIRRETRSSAGQQIRDSDLKVGSKISFYDIYFLQSTPEILEKSGPALEELIRVMKENPTLEIRIEGHTDNVGDPGKNMVLSEQRAEAIKAYLVRQGIPPGRIKTKGFGPHAPMTSNATEELREKNRRVEIRILKE